MIRAIHFQNYKVLQRTELPLGAFNLIVGPNGSGKSTAVQALLALRDFARERLGMSPPAHSAMGDRCEADLVFDFGGDFSGVSARIVCAASRQWEHLELTRDGQAWRNGTESLLQFLAAMRAFNFEAGALARPVGEEKSPSLGTAGETFPWLLEQMRRSRPDSWEDLQTEFSRLMPEFVNVKTRQDAKGLWHFSAINQTGLEIPAENLSQGTLVALATLALSFFEERPSVVCLEELERGIHPRLLREIRDALYRLSYPRDYDDNRPAIQVVATTHSPYLLDLFSEHPEEVILTAKEGVAASFQRLVDLPDLPDLLATGKLGDLWYSGVIGGVPY